MLGRALLGNQKIHINRREVRVRQMLLAVMMRPSHRRSDQMQASGTAVTQPGKIKMVENLQHLDQDRATARRWVGGHGKAPVFPENRFARTDPIARQIFGGDEPAIGPDILGDPGRQSPGIKTSSAIAGQRLYGVGHVRVADDLADLGKTVAGAQINLAAGRARLDPGDAIRHPRRPGPGPEIPHMRRQGIALAGQPRRRRQ